MKKYEWRSVRGHQIIFPFREKRLQGDANEYPLIHQTSKSNLRKVNGTYTSSFCSIIKIFCFFGMCIYIIFDNPLLHYLKKKGNAILLEGTYILTNLQKKGWKTLYKINLFSPTSTHRASSYAKRHMTTCSGQKQQENRPKNKVREKQPTNKAC